MSNNAYCGSTDSRPSRIQSTTEAPFITAIVGVFDRDQYVGEAIASALDQTLSPSKYEVLLVSSLEEASLQRILSELAQTDRTRIRVIPQAPQPVGPFQAAGSRVATGEVVTILDDDDLWEPTRLQTIYDAFMRYPDLCYFHNGQSFIDERGIRLRRVAGKKARHARTLGHIPAAELDTALAMLSSSNADFNTSSIAVRKSVMLGHASDLIRIDSLQDTFYFYMALVDRGGFFITGEPLTRYRLHEQNASVKSRGGNLVGLDRAHQHTGRQLLTLDTVLPSVLATARPSLLKLWKRDHAFISLLNQVQGRTANRRQRIEIVTELARSGLQIDPRTDLKAVLLGLAGVIDPGLAGLIYSHFRG